MARAAVVAAWSLASCACLSGCSSRAQAEPDDAGGGASDECAAFVSTADLTTPVVSFMSDVVPLLQKSCTTAGSVCHGDPKVTAQGRPFLGLPEGGENAEEIAAGIVGVASAEDPAMTRVAAGQPSSSYLMHKVDGDQCGLASACAKGQSAYPTCGVQMPYSSEPLDIATRDTIRRWIAQGAK